jgi:Ca2+:H+ antiporter
VSSQPESFSDLDLSRIQRKMGHLLTVLLIDRLKCAVHKETWYTEAHPSHTFRRASTWAVGVGRGAGTETIATPDIEAQLEIPGPRRMSSEPPLVSGPHGGSVSQWSLQEDGISPTTLAPSTIFSGKSEMREMRGARGDERPGQDMLGESQRIGRPPNGEQSADQNFTPKFLHETRNSLRRKPFTLGNQLRATIFNSWINLLLIAAPVGIALHFVNVSPVAVFVINFVAIIPLAALLSYATEEIAIRASDTVGSLLNATFGFFDVSISKRILLTCS